MASYETNRSIHCEHRWQKVARRTTHMSAKRSNNTVNGALCTGNGYRVGDGDAKAVCKDSCNSTAGALMIDAQGMVTKKRKAG